MVESPFEKQLNCHFHPCRTPEISLGNSITRHPNIVVYTKNWETKKSPVLSLSYLLGCWQPSLDHPDRRRFSSEEFWTNHNKRRSKIFTWDPQGDSIIRTPYSWTYNQQTHVHIHIQILQSVFLSAQPLYMTIHPKITRFLGKSLTWKRRKH